MSARNMDLDLGRIFARSRPQKLPHEHAYTGRSGAGELVYPPRPAPPPSGYTAPAVRFASGASLIEDSFTITPTNLCTISMWVKASLVDLGFGLAFLGSTNLRPVYGNFFADPTDLGLALGANDFTMGSAPGVISGDTWLHYFASTDTSHGPGSNIGSLYANGVSVGSITNDTWDGSGGATIIGGGFVQPWAVNSGGSGVLEVADVQVWFNQAIDPTPTNLAKFISGGKPVNPVTAASAFGTQGLLFSGNASTFATNLGNVGGTFTVSGDPITNASTSPST